ADFTLLSYTMPAANNVVYYPALRSREKSNNNGLISFDDFFIYIDKSPSIDLQNPSAVMVSAVAMQGSSFTATFANGTDSGSGVDGYLILRAPGLAVTA